MKLFKVTNTNKTTSDPAGDVDMIHRVMAHSANHKVPVFGAPTHCPDCGEWGLVDRTDESTTFNHCYLCGGQWEITRAALATVAAQPRRLHAERPATGVLYGSDSRNSHPSNPTFVPSTLEPIPNRFNKPATRLQVVSA